MSVKASQAKLTQAAKDLFASWHRTKETWQDENRRRFEKKYLDLLQAELRKTQIAMERMDTVLFRVRQDCK